MSHRDRDVEDRSRDDRLDARDDRRGEDLGDRDSERPGVGDHVSRALVRWRDGMAEAVESAASDPGRAGARQLTAMLEAQRHLLEQVKSSLTEFQRMIETVEKGLHREGEAGGGTGMPMMTPMAAGLLPKGAAELMSSPMRGPMTAMLSMQKVALSSVGLWAKAAQDCHGIWAGAMQSMVPGLANGGGERDQGASRPRK